MLVRKSSGGGAGDFKADGSIIMTGPLSTNVGTFTSAVANGASAVAFDYNTPAYSTAGAMIARFKNNGVVKASVDKDGYLLAEKFSVTSTGSPFGWTEIRYGSNGWVFKSYAQDMLYVSGQNACINTQGTKCFGWAPSSAIEGVTADTRLYRGAAGRVDVCTTSTGTYGGLKAADFTLTVGGITSEVANGASANGFTLNTASLTTTGAEIVEFQNNSVKKAGLNKDGGFISLGDGAASALSYGMGASAGNQSGMYTDAGFQVNFACNGVRRANVTSGGFGIAAGGSYFFDVSGPFDLGVSRNAAGVVEVNNGTVGTFRDIKVRSYLVDATNTAPGTTGARTINKSAGTVNFAAATTSLVVTNSLVTTSSLVFCTIRTNDATAVIKNVVPAAGSFTINLNAAATDETSVGFIVYN